MADIVCTEESELLPNLDDDLLDAEVSALFHNYLQMSEMNMRDSGIRLDSSDCSSTSSSVLPLTPLERLIRTHPIWFLPEVDREEATHILHIKETGNFLVRRSNDTKTALSVKLGTQHGFEVDHFILKEERGKVSLSSSCLEFDTILSLIYHYTTHGGDLPVQLSLPSILRQTEGRQCLSSLSLLGRDFWRYPMSNPGRQSLMLLNLSSKTIQQERSSDPECRSQQDVNCAPRPPQRFSLRSRSTSISPTQAKRKSEFSFLNVAPTISPKMKHIPEKLRLDSVGQNAKCKRREVKDFSSNTKSDKPVNQEDSMLYFKSPRNDKMSDYEDIWEKTPGPESPNHPLCEETISPTLSETKFKQFLFNRFFDGNFSHSTQEEVHETSEHTEESNDIDYVESSPSYPSCSSPSSDSSSSLFSNISDSSDNESDTSEYSDPLQVLENLSEEDTNNETDEEEIRCLIEEDVHSIQWGNDTDHTESSSKINEPFHSDLETSHSLCDLPKHIIEQDGEKVEPTKSSIGGLLRKLSIKRKPSITKQSNKQEKRLSAVIGCYLTPSLLGWKDYESCQVDSSSWEFLDQNEEPRMEYFKEIENQVELNSQSIDIIQPAKLSTSPIQTEEKAESKFGAENEDDSTLDSLYHTDHSDEGQRYQSSERQNIDSIQAIKNYVEDLTTKEDSILGQTVLQFIACTEDSSVDDPTLIMRNMRQVMNGLKNYLIITGEGEFFQLLKLERAKLSPDQFLDLDTILEEVMQNLIVRPLRKHLELIFIQDFTRSGCVQLLSKNITFALSLSYRDFNIPQEFEPNLKSLVDICRNSLTRMREAFSPSDKLTCFLEIINHVIQSVSPVTEISLPHICSILCYLMIQTNWDTMEIECEYMWGLLPPTSLAREGGYYLSLLSCAVHMLKNLSQSQEPEPVCLPTSMPRSPLLQVSVPDEQTNSLAQWTVPIRPGMSVKDVTRCLQATLRCHGDCALFICKGGQETLLEDDCKVDNLLVECADKSVILVFKRRGMKIILP